MGKIRRNLYIGNGWYVKQVASNRPIQREGEREKKIGETRQKVKKMKV